MDAILSFRRLFVGVLLAAALSPCAFALGQPAGEVILTVTGKVGEANRGKAAVFDKAMLEALPQQSFTTSTPWYKLPVKFSGPLLADVLAAVGAKGTALRAVALNDYKVSIPVADTMNYKVIVALTADGKPMAVRDKGPLFIIYPFDSSAELHTTKFYERSIWQLKAIEIE